MLIKLLLMLILFLANLHFFEHKFQNTSFSNASLFSYPSEKRKNEQCNLNLRRGLLMFIHAQGLKEQFSDMSKLRKTLFSISSSLDSGDHQRQ